MLRCVSSQNAPVVVGKLLDDDCPEDFFKGLISSVRSLLPLWVSVKRGEISIKLLYTYYYLYHCRENLSLFLKHVMILVFLTAAPSLSTMEFMP